ncbi:hypothetical protein [Actinoplanes regularis]|uniref:hypothetical protein n=1 Tax=Actinoplanes regularis TaxID=52697 RepID=UPI0024A42F55|nr:hypothetical protein [Actinoplanes regularis]GLW29179.1 hypothetical protein Areg01_21190 [Actinoplanes regularis]
MYRTRRNKMSATTRKVIIGLSTVTLAGGAFAVSTGISSAGENCDGLDQALRQNLQFIAAQQATPDAQSAARIANRQAVVDLINQRRIVAGCTKNIAAEVGGGAAAQPAPTQGQGQGQAQNKPAPTTPATTTPAGGNNGNAGNAAAGEVVCKGSTVTLSGEGGAPGASSNAFPIGTTLKVTNLDNNKSTTVKVTSPSGSCILLNNAAFEQVREPGKFLIRRAVIERVG